ncbi:hypothetical protein [Chondromyces crocatus]|uniref:Uncharacterized protein n=1 Tax=Chondromyces crocatus TaxID=52 RepID=A0A0K1EPM0_CHOCO|nr:hypothetical protein [Chondromyces crocatus]AKT42587.1 uncharacterized protein CMC5_068140 [Chondromyces crocatus]
MEPGRDSATPKADDARETERGDDAREAEHGDDTRKPERGDLTPAERDDLTPAEKEARATTNEVSLSPPLLAVSQWTLRGLARATLVALLALGTGAALGTLITRAPSPTDPNKTARPAPASAAERAILAPLSEGDSLGDYEVTEIQGVSPQGAVRVICTRDRATIRLDVALVTEEGPEPPAFTDKYAVFYSLKNAPPEDGERLAQTLVKILKKNESTPAPPGMATFTPKPLPPI